ncbi:MAG: hypothetical protein ACHQUC_09550 [Chlamydiales bacterium]
MDIDGQSKRKEQDVQDASQHDKQDEIDLDHSGTVRDTINRAEKKD